MKSFPGSILRGRGTPKYKLYWYVPLRRAWFSCSLVPDRLQKSESVGLKTGIIYHES